MQGVEFPSEAHRNLSDHLDEIEVHEENLQEVQELTDLFFDQLIEVSYTESNTRSGTIAWDQDKLDMVEYLANIAGEVWEIGGPTEEYTMIDQARIKNTFRVVNIPPAPGLNTYREIPTQVSVLADGSQLPIGDKILAGLLISNFSGERNALIQEVSRVLKTDGLLVWQGGKPEDLAMMLTKGFVLQSFKLTIVDQSEKPDSKKTGQQLVWSGVFKKTDKEISSSDVVPLFVNIIKNSKKEEIAFEIPNFDPSTGRSLTTDAERVEVIKNLYWTIGVKVPDEDADGKLLTPEEKMKYLKEKYSTST